LILINHRRASRLRGPRVVDVREIKPAGSRRAYDFANALTGISP
jgi:hypothetical protein